MATLTTTVEPLDGNRVRLRVAVPSAEFEKAIDAAFRKLAREVKVPGFRPGKAPRQLLEARLGTEVAREQALRDALPDYYAQAVAAEALDTIAPPEIDITAGEESGDVEFDAVVQVRPVVELVGYQGLRIEIPNPAVPEEAVDAQVDALRDRFADLADSAAPLTDGDYATIDIKGYVHDEVIDALSATDFLYEIGSATVVPKLDDELRGKRPGDILKFNDTLPDRFGDRAGQEVAFQVLVKETKRKVLPEATNEWVSEVTEFETLDELRADTRRRLEMLATIRAQMLVRDKVLETVADLVTVEIPDVLVEQEMRARLRDFVQRLDAQGVTLEQYLGATGQDQDAFVSDLREGATRAVKADLALRAVVTAEGITVDDDEVEAELARAAERSGRKLAKVRKDLERQGVVEAVRSDLIRGKALRFLIDHAEVVDEAGNPVELALPAGEPAPAEAESPMRADHSPDLEESEA